MNPASRRLKKLLYTLIKINAFCREAAVEFFYGVYFYELLYFAVDFFGEGNHPFANSGGLYPDPPDGEPAARKENRHAQFKTGLYYFGARYLDTRTGRWIGCDPLGPELADPMDEEGKLKEGYSVLEGTDWYSYCSNNPINMIDPTGLDDIYSFLHWDQKVSQDAFWNGRHYQTVETTTTTKFRFYSKNKKILTAFKNNNQLNGTVIKQHEAKIETSKIVKDEEEFLDMENTILVTKTVNIHTKTLGQMGTDKIEDVEEEIVCRIQVDNDGNIVKCFDPKKENRESPEQEK